MWGARRKDLEEFWIPQHQSIHDLNIEELARTLCLYDEDTNEVYCIWGIEDDGVLDRVIWMLCTKKVEEHPIAFLRYCKTYLKDLLDTKPLMWNYVWLGNELHVKWLKWMGATFGETTTINGEPFQYFYFSKKE